MFIVLVTLTGGLRAQEQSLTPSEKNLLLDAVKDLKGKVKIVSIVPQLNTPTCDEQTHQFSEQNGGLDSSNSVFPIWP